MAIGVTVVAQGRFWTVTGIALCRPGSRAVLRPITGWARTALHRWELLSILER